MILKILKIIFVIIEAILPLLPDVIPGLEGTEPQENPEKKVLYAARDDVAKMMANIETEKGNPEKPHGVGG